MRVVPEGMFARKSADLITIIFRIWQFIEVANVKIEIATVLISNSRVED